MQIIAKSTAVRISPRKVRLIAGALSNLSAKEALVRLSVLNKRSSYVLINVLKSAIANAIHNAKKQEDNLLVKQVLVSEGPFLKRFHPSTRGRVHPYKKRSSHIKVVLEERINT